MANLDDIFNSYKDKDKKKTIEVISKTDPPTLISKDELISKASQPKPNGQVQNSILTSPSTTPSAPVPSPTPIIHPVILKCEPPSISPSVIKNLSSNEEYDFSPEKSVAKHTGLIYALKGEGKTTLAFSFPGSHVCFSFDKKSVLISENPENVTRVTVYDGLRYLDRSSAQAWLDSSEKTWKYLNSLFKQITVKPDWVVVDGGEVLETTLEMVMRGRNGLMPFQGVSNRSVWKERRMYLEQFYRMCLNLSNKGVLWTSYVESRELIEEGTLRTKKEVPRWLDVVMMETDFLIRVERETDKTGQRYYATVETSKWKVIPSGPRIDITSRGILALARGEL